MAAHTTPDTDFNPLPRKEGDAASQPVRVNQNNFNPLPRKEGDTTVSSVSSPMLIDFNPLPRKEGDNCHGLHLL